MRDVPGTIAVDRPGAALLHGDHVVKFYEHDDVLADVVAAFLREALRAGAPGLAIATAAHRDAVRRRLAGSGIDVARALATGQLQLLDAEEMLAGFMVDGAPDPARFVATVGEVVARAIASAPGSVLHAYGEMVDLLWSTGHQQAALQLEGLWNELGRVHAFALLCAYAMGSFYRAPSRVGLDEVCRLHSHAQVLTAPSGGGELTALQERIRSLAREIELRGELERALRLRIQEQERAEQEARRQAADRAQLVAQLRETVQYHELFAGVLAHDLRGPLGAILTAAELMLRRQEGDGDRVTRPLSRILSSGERMKRLIEQLLDFTSARLGGGIEIRPRPADLGEICRQVLGELEMAHPERTILVDARGDLAGVWDADRLMQVVSNLAGNAIQHGEPGALRVELDGTEPDQVWLRFSNPGTVPAELQGALFDPFRGTAYRHRNGGTRGIGLGLYITRALVQAHGGEVEYESAGGTTMFSVRLRRGVGAS